MSRAFAPPGFEAARSGRSTVLLRADAAAALLAAGLGRVAWWSAGADERAPARGRGGARRAIAGGHSLFVKPMKRGGWVGPLWRDRFLGTGRLRANLEAPTEFGRRGLATPAAMAMLVVEGPAFCYRAWLAVEALDGGVDLAARLATPAPAPSELVGQVLAEVRRMHDAGVEHRDLNLGNVLVFEGRADPVRIVDLDRVRFHGGPLSFRLRRASLRRLERSYVKEFGDEGPLGPGGRDLWYDLYAAGDPGLGRKLRRRRAVGRLWIALHRLFWAGRSRSAMGRPEGRGR